MNVSWSAQFASPCRPRVRPGLGFLAALLLALLGGGVSGAEAIEGTWTVDRAIERAFDANPDARVANHRIDAARAALSEARSSYWPRLGAASGYARTDNPASVFGSVLNQRAFGPGLDFNDPGTVDNWNVHGLVTVPIYTGGSRSAGVDAANEGWRAAREMAAVTRQDIAFEVVRLFHSLSMTRAFVEAAGASVEAFEANRGTARRRLEAGTILKIEVLDVEVRLAQAREDLARARNAHALARRALMNLLGFDGAADGMRVDLESVSELAGPVGSAAGHEPNRRELAAAEARIRAAGASVRVARAGYRPRVNAFGRVDRDEGWETGGSGHSWAAGLLMEWDVWDGRLTGARVRRAEAEEDARREEARKAELAIDFELARAELNLEAAGERLKATDKMVEQAQESAGLTRSRFGQGLALATQLIDSETALTAARVRRAEAEGDYGIALAALRRALGLGQLPGSPAGEEMK